jgi:HEAT repeat protein
LNGGSVNTIVVLGVIAVVQTVFLVMLVAFLLARRAYDRARRATFTVGRAALVRPVRDWLVADGSIEPVVDALAALPAAAVVGYTSFFVRGNVPREKRAELAVALRDARWIRRAVASSGSRRWWRRIEAARAIALVGTADDRDAVRRLLDDEQPAVAIAAVDCLPRVADAALVGTVLDRFATLPVMVRHYLVTTMSEMRTLVEPELVARLRSDAPAAALAHWIALAGALVSRPALQAAGARSGHESDVVRAAVADALRRVPNDATLFTLSILLCDDSAIVRERAAASLGHLASPKALSMLQASMRDSSWAVRRRSALALAQLGESGRIAVRVLTADADPYVANMATVVSGLSAGALLELTED